MTARHFAASNDAEPERAIALNESHRRHVAVSLRHAAELLDDAERILIASRSESPFSKFTSDLAPWQAGVISDQIAAIRRKLVEAGNEMGLDLAGYALDARHAIYVHATFASNDIEEMHARYLRGYGELDPESARRIDALADVLASAIQELERAIKVRPGESIEARIERLSRSPVSPEILRTLDRIITAYHVAELRRPMATLVERIEQRTFNIAVFGRVSSGKSSLLNALLGAPILPVGVTPITAVPTRIRFGEPPSVRIVYGDKREETVGIERLAELASETENPGNRRRVALLQVRYPSPLLRDGVEFVDTPGIGSLATKGAEETFAYLPRADLAILLVDVGSAIGPDELSILRLLQSATIPVQLVISKADLADEESIARMQGYVRDVVARDAGITPTIHPVSAVASGEALLRRWVDDSIQPLLDHHEEMLDASIRRTAGALRDALTARLETLTHKRAPQVTDTIGHEARAVVFELRERIKNIRRQIEEADDELLNDAATKLFNDQGERWEPKAVLAATVQTFLDEKRTALISSRRETAIHLHDVAARAGVSPELLSPSAPGDDLAQMPLLDVAAVLPDTAVAAPFLTGVAPMLAKRRLANRLHDAFAKPLRDALRSYAHRLGDWSLKSVDRVQASFVSALDATSGGTAADVDLRSIDDDLRTLAEMTSDPIATKENS